MTIDVDGLKGRRDIVEVVGNYVALKKRGAEFVGLCPFHADKTPSFWVVPAKQICHCFVCDATYDVISFVREFEGVDFKRACEILGAKDDWQSKAPVKQEAAPLPERITSKPPADAPAPKFTIRQLGEPVLTFPIRDLDGSLIAYECRYEPPEGKKEIRIWSWGARGDRAPGWGVGHLNAPRPLYGLDRLGANPGATVLITEGPKKADAGQRLLPTYASVSITGGANGWHKHNYEPLRGKAVLLFPDNDEPGITAFEKLAGVLVDPRGLACKVRVIDPRGIPDGWDIADWTGTTAELIAWAKPRASDYKPNAAPQVSGVCTASAGSSAAPAVAAPNPAPSVSEPPPTAAESAPPQAEPADAGPPEPPPEGAPEPPRKRKPRLAVVGNTALAPEENAEALPAAMSEDMLSERFADEHAGKWRYVKPWGSWFEWRGDGWYKDDTGKIDFLAVQLTRQALYWSEAACLTTPDSRRKVNSRRTAGAVRDIAMYDRRIAAVVDQWDTDPWLLGVPGGVVDLRTGELSDANPEQYITKRTSVMPQPGPAPIWEQFLRTVADDNEKLIAFLQRYAGYSLTGETREQCLAFLYGTGQNGKGVFITTLKQILGDYAVTADADVFMESEHQRHPTEMARLRGARLVAVDETDGSKRWNEKRIKRVTGGGKIEAHFMRQDDFEFMPQFKLLIAGNHKPQLRGVGKAIQRRIHLVPFTVTIRDEDRDDELPKKLEAEYPQILQWMIEGCSQWLTLGLDAPAEVVDATSRYIEAEDVIGEWLEERTEQKGETARPIAYKNYRAWMEARGERPWSTKAFWAALEERGYTDRKSNGTFFIVGLSLRMTHEPEPQSYPYDG